MSAAFVLVALLAQAAPEAPRPSRAGQDCHEIMGGTGGIHPIRTVCPAAERALAEFGRRLKENGLIAGKACPGGFAYLRSGGRREPAGGLCLSGAQGERRIEAVRVFAGVSVIPGPDRIR